MHVYMHAYIYIHAYIRYDVQLDVHIYIFVFSFPFLFAIYTIYISLFFFALISCSRFNALMLALWRSLSRTSPFIDFPLMRCKN